MLYYHILETVGQTMLFVFVGMSKKTSRVNHLTDLAGF